eukprot:1345768-Amorphochlora_amoeboformis.AAC.1
MAGLQARRCWPTHSAAHPAGSTKRVPAHCGTKVPFQHNGHVPAHALYRLVLPETGGYADGGCTLWQLSPSTVSKNYSLEVPFRCKTRFVTLSRVYEMQSEISYEHNDATAGMAHQSPFHRPNSSLTPPQNCTPAILLPDNCTLL